MSPVEPVISVLLAVHNSFEYLGPAIDSILKQTYRKFELILIDDASTDGSSEILSKFQKQDERVIVLYNSSNLGLAESLNRGYRVSSGEFIARMDADDIAVPERFEKQKNFLVEHPEIDLIGSDAAIIDDSGRKTGVSTTISDPELLKKIIKYRTVAFHPSWMFRRCVFETINGYRDFPVCQDYDFLLRTVEAGFNVSNYPEVLICLRRYTGVSSRKSIVVRKSTDYILSLRKERQLSGRDSYTRDQAYKYTQNNAMSLFLQNLSQKFLVQASINKNRKHKLEASIFYCLSCLVSVHQMKLFFRIFRAWIIVRSWQRQI